MDMNGYQTFWSGYELKYKYKVISGHDGHYRMSLDGIGCKRIFIQEHGWISKLTDMS
jgi:hypothetical protein